jgi:hypothetical protein
MDVVADVEIPADLCQFGDFGLAGKASGIPAVQRQQLDFVHEGGEQAHVGEVMIRVDEGGAGQPERVASPGGLRQGRVRAAKYDRLLHRVSF